MRPDPAIRSRRPSLPVRAALTPAEMEARVLYRDALVIVLDKPAGVPVHPGPGGGPNLEHGFEALRYGLPRLPALAHRLDRDTSGCLVLGRHRQALAKLGRLFATGRVEKVYWAITRGAPGVDAGTLDLPLRKETPERGWKMVVDPVAGQNAVTDWRVLGRAEGIAWIECRPRTGRTHQIRVHLATLGCPVLGDPIYGADPEPAAALPPALSNAAAPPLHLHARAIGLPLYAKRPPVVVEADPPAHMHRALLACGWTPAGAASADPSARTPMAGPR